MNDYEMGKKFYESIVHFDESDEAKEFYYRTMDSRSVNAAGREETIRDRILRAYGILFCEDTGLEMGHPAGPDEVAATADRLYIGSVGYDSKHWYRMRYHFPVIDDDNYDRFAALVLADLRSGPLHDSVLEDGDMLLVGDADPLHMTAEQRKNQKVSAIRLPGGYDDDDHSGR